MKNIALTLVILAGTIASTFNACKKPSTPNYPINNSLKAAFNFQPGTYWIYRDSISGDVDSFYVQANGTGNNSNSAGYTYDLTEVQIFEVSALISIDTQYWQYYYLGNVIEVGYYGPKMHEADYAPFINYPFQDSLTFPHYGSSNLLNADSGSVARIFTSYTLNTNVFTNVAETYQWYNNNAGTGLLFNDIFFICPNIGIIKMKLYHPLDAINRVWELQRYHIVK